MLDKHILLIHYLFKGWFLILQAFSLTGVRNRASNTNSLAKPGSDRVDQLVRTFSSDPSLIAFAQLCCDSSSNSR